MKKNKIVLPALIAAIILTSCATTSETTEAQASTHHTKEKAPKAIIMQETKEDSFLKFRSLLDKLEMPRLENVTKEAITQLAETVNLQRLSNHPFSLSYSDLYKMYEGILSKA